MARLLIGDGRPSAQRRPAVRGWDTGPGDPPVLSRQATRSSPG
ncbi:hypothetical protein ACFPM0_18830 [Pseudonocardia sulfidoxydans]